MQVANIPHRQNGTAFILVGDALAIVSLFLPWLLVSTSFGDHPGDQGLGPWTLLSWNIETSPQIALWIFLAFFLAVIVLVACSVVVLLTRATALRTAFAVLGDILAVCCILFALGAMAVQVVGGALVWPYYDTHFIGIGAVAGFVGFICIIAGLTQHQRAHAH